MHQQSPDGLAAICRRQMGLFTLSQAKTCGLKSQTIYRRKHAGAYIQVYPGVFRVSVVPDSCEARHLAAQLAVGGEAAIARRSAAGLLGIGHGLADDGIHVAVRSRSYTRPPDGVVVHRSSTFREQHVQRVHGVIRVTVVPRTLCEMAGELHPDRLRGMVAAAVRDGTTTAEALRDFMEVLGRFRGKQRLREVVDELSPLETATRSELESRFLRLTTRAGIPPDAMNHPVMDAFGRRRYLDAVYLAQRQPVELDSRSYHGTLVDWHDDLRRENAVKLAGYRDPLRFSWDDVVHRPDDVIDVLRRALDR